MTHREFEELTKVKVSDETYTNTIEPAYMLDDMDKQIFCSEFKEHGFEFVALRAIRHTKRSSHSAIACDMSSKVWRSNALDLQTMMTPTWQGNW